MRKKKPLSGLNDPDNGLFGIRVHDNYYADRLHAATYRICHCEPQSRRGNLQHRGIMTAVPINIEHFGFPMLIG